MVRDFSGGIPLSTVLSVLRDCVAEHPHDPPEIIEQAASLKESATQLAAALNDPGLKASLATFAETVARGP